VVALETARLRLRPLTTADADLWVALHADEQVSRFVGSYTRDAALDRLAGIERQWSERGHGLFAIESRESGEFLGRGGLSYVEHFNEVEAGWTFRAQAWGCGYATEAARRFIDWGFKTLEASYFTAMIHPGNTASERVAKRLGFRAGRQDVFRGRPITVYVLARPEDVGSGG
jgi:RimJ/RimL family protein N-acetyltransferase